MHFVSKYESLRQYYHLKYNFKYLSFKYPIIDSFYDNIVITIKSINGLFKLGVFAFCVNILYALFTLNTQAYCDAFDWNILL